MTDAFDRDEHRRWEQRCLARARDGDQRGFAELYRAFAPELYRRILFPRLGNRQAAEDALSETFRTLLERLDDLSDQGVSLYHWLSRVAVNKATDMHRAKGRTQRALVNLEVVLGPLRDDPADTQHPVERAQNADHLRQAVAAALEAMNPRYRRAIELRFFEEQSREDCATHLEIKLGTFDVLLLRALRAFRKEWEARVGRGEELAHE